MPHYLFAASNCLLKRKEKGLNGYYPGGVQNVLKALAVLTPRSKPSYDCTMVRPGINIFHLILKNEEVHI